MNCAPTAFQHFRHRHRLGKHGGHEIAPSRFGFLGSPIPDGANSASQADAYACLPDALGIAQAGVVGISINQIPGAQLIPLQKGGQHSIFILEPMDEPAITWRAL